MQLLNFNGTKTLKKQRQAYFNESYVTLIAV